MTSRVHADGGVTQTLPPPGLPQWHGSSSSLVDGDMDDGDDDTDGDALPPGRAAGARTRCSYSQGGMPPEEAPHLRNPFANHLRDPFAPPPAKRAAKLVSAGVAV